MALLLISFLCLIAVVCLVVGWKITGAQREDYSRLASLSESLLAYLRDGLRESVVTNVLTRTDGTLSHVTLIGRNFSAECTWPSGHETTDDDTPHLLLTLEGRVELTKGVVLRKHFDSLLPRAALGDVLLFTLLGDGCDNECSRKKHGISCKLELKDRAGTTVFVANDFIMETVLKKSTHDRLLTDIFLAIKTAVNPDSYKKSPA